MSKSIVLYLHAHQPWRVKPYSVFDMASDHQYFDSHVSSTDNRAIIEKVAEKSYRPMNHVLQLLLERHPEFKISLSLTGTLLEQLEVWAPDVIESFQRLVKTGRVEIVAETYYHSLAFFYDREEFTHHVEQHATKINELFGVKPTAFRNTELAYNDELAQWADTAGYKAILAEGWGPVLGWRSPNFVYQPAHTESIRLMMKNYQLSDDIAFRFSDKNWHEHPLTAEKFKAWADDASRGSDIINLFMDYETFGEHQWSESGIFEFFEAFVAEWLMDSDRDFAMITEAATRYDSKDYIETPRTTTWADTERDLTAWLGNAMQQETIQYLYDMKHKILTSGDTELIEDWRKLQTSDHFYYMCTKWFNDGDVHAYFSPYDSPYDAFLYYMNAIRDTRWRAMRNMQIGGLHG